MITKTGLSARFATTILAACVVFGLGMPATESNANEPSIITETSRTIEYPTTTSDVALEVRFVGESVKQQIRRAELAALQVIEEGLNYASSKLCKIEVGKDLDRLNLASKKSVEALTNKLKQNRSLLEKGLQKLFESYQLVKSNPSLAKSHRESAVKDFKQLTKQGTEVDQSLTELQQNLIKTEVLYQRVLAECLLDDFKSIFGGGGIPLPVPDDGDDKWPDELWNDGDPPASDFLDYID